MCETGPTGTALPGHTPFPMPRYAGVERIARAKPLCYVRSASHNLNTGPKPRPRRTTMADEYLVMIDFPVLLENLRDSDTSQDWDDAAVESWLLEQGFRETKEGWLADAFTLSRLSRDEIISATRL